MQIFLFRRCLFLKVSPPCDTMPDRRRYIHKKQGARTPAPFHIVKCLYNMFVEEKHYEF